MVTWVSPPGEVGIRVPSGSCFSVQPQTSSSNDGTGYPNNILTGRSPLLVNRMHVREGRTIASACLAIRLSVGADTVVHMEAEKNPDYLRQLTENVREFRDAFVSLLELHTPTYTGPGRGIAPPVSPHDGVDMTDLEARRARVSTAAGRARRAPGLTGVKFGVQGVKGTVDPIAAWNTVTQPKPALEPANIIDACDQMIGSLEDLVARAEAEAPPKVGVAAMHPAVWGLASRLWRDGHYRQAVSAAADGVIGLVKSRTGRNDIADTSQWQQAFSNDPPQPGRPRLRWPGDQTDQTVKSMNDGLRQFAPGAQMTIRNPATHGSAEMSEQEAAERLAVLSLLARWVDQCNLLEAPAPQTGGDEGK